MSLPTGLAGAMNALGNYGDSRRADERIVTLLWLRILTDPLAPLIGGYDPRTILDPPLTWEEMRQAEPVLLDVLCGRLNEVMGEALLETGWTDDLPPEAVKKALHEVGRWVMPAGDPLGAATMLLMSAGSKSAKGAFYTPYEVSLLMAMVTGPKPGESVCDPACGSGGMLLAALEAVRTAHGPQAMLQVFGQDIDPAAVRICKLNLALAGIAPQGRGLVGDAPEPTPADFAAGHQLSLL